MQDLKSILDRIRQTQQVANRDSHYWRDTTTLIAIAEKAGKVVEILKAHGMNLGVVQVPPPITDTERLYELKDAVRAYVEVIEEEGNQ